MWQDALRSLSPCPEARQWAQDYATFAEAWQACERGDWMLWLVGRTIAEPNDSAERKRIVLCACACARLALPYVEAGEKRPLMAIETAEQWAHGENGVSLVDVRKAADAAAAASASSAASAASSAASASAAAYAYAASDAYAAYAASAASAAADAAYAAARAQVLKQCAEIVRERYTVDEIGLGK